MKQRKILILGGTHSDIPLIKAAKRLGFYVITTGNQPQGLGHIYSDEYYYADYSNLDSMLQLAKKIKIDAICSGCNDFSAISSAYVAEKLGIPGHDTFETTLKLHHKDSYRKFALENGISTPFAKSYSDYNEAKKDINNFLYPIIIKPVDLTGGKGVSKVNSKNEYNFAVEKAFNSSKAKRIVIEEFIEGTLHSFSCFLRNKKVVFYYTANEFSYINPFLVSTLSSPALVSDEVINDIITQSEKIANLLSLKDGLFHIQFILNENKKPVIIEITRRCPGDLYSYTVEYSTGIDYTMWILKTSIGMNSYELSHIPQNGYYSRHCIMSNKNGKIKDVIFREEIRGNVIDSMMWWKKGDEITDYMTYKSGIVFLKYSSLEEMIYKTNNINELIKIEVQ